MTAKQELLDALTAERFAAVPPARTRREALVDALADDALLTAEVYDVVNRRLFAIGGDV